MSDDVLQAEWERTWVRLLVHIRHHDRLSSKQPRTPTDAADLNRLDIEIGQLKTRSRRLSEVIRRDRDLVETKCG